MTKSISPILFFLIILALGFSAPGFSATSPSPQIACTPGIAMSVSTTDPTTKLIIQTIENIGSGQLVSSMAKARGYSYEFCWIKTNNVRHPLFPEGASTAYWHTTLRNGEKASGIFYSVETLNRVLQISGRAEFAAIPALFIVYHELAHMTAQLGTESGELISSFRRKNVFRTILPLVDRFAGSEELLLSTITGSTAGAETFADCYGSYLMGIAMLTHGGNQTNPASLLDRIYRQQFSVESLRSAMRVAASISSQLLHQDVHGTARERQSFVSYGLSVASWYLPLLKRDATAAANSAFLACANMAYDQSAAKSAFRKAKGLNGEFLALDLDQTRGF